MKPDTTLPGSARPRLNRAGALKPPGRLVSTRFHSKFGLFSGSIIQHQHTSTQDIQRHLRFSKVKKRILEAQMIMSSTSSTPFMSCRGNVCSTVFGSCPNDPPTCCWLPKAKAPASGQLREDRDFHLHRELSMAMGDPQVMVSVYFRAKSNIHIP